ncbi:MAG: hypothetical protein ACR2OU_07890 [Thermomicrobiales bacterium]
MSKNQGERGADRIRQVMSLSSERVFVDWLGLFSNLPSEYWSDWHPLVFVPLEVETEWKRWSHAIGEAMEDLGGGPNMQSHGDRVLLTPQNQKDFSNLFLMPGTWTSDDGKMRGLIAFTAGEPHQDEFWISTLQTATLALTHDLIEMPWKAAIGPYPHQNMGQSTTRLSLSDAVIIGGMLIKPLNKCVVDRSFSRQNPSLMSLVRAESWPLTVAGTSFGYERQALKESVTKDLVLLSGVFSLATGIPWTVRELPFVSGDNEIYMAEDFYGPKNPNENEGPSEFVLPEWVDAAYWLAKENEDYRNALLMFSESLRLEGTHPSITMIAYMACLQSLGRIVEPNKDKKQLTAILNTVRNEEDVKKLLRYYGHRSETAYRGVLWGTEAVALSQSIDFNPFAKNELPFWSGLWQVKEALIDAFSWVLTHRSETE